MDQSVPNRVRRSASSMHNSVDFAADGSENEFYFVDKSLSVPFQWETEPGRAKSQSEMPSAIYPLKPPPHLKRPLLHGTRRLTLRHRSVSSKLKSLLFRLLFGTSHKSDYSNDLLSERSPQVDEIEPIVADAYETSSSTAEVSADSPLSESFSHQTTPKRFSASEIPTIQAFLHDKSEMLMDPILTMGVPYHENPSAIRWILDPRINIGVPPSTSPLKHSKPLTSHRQSVEHEPTVLPKTTLKLKDILHICNFSESPAASTEKCLSDVGESEFSYTNPNTTVTAPDTGEEDGKYRSDARPASFAIQRVNRHRRAISVPRNLMAFVRDGICGSHRRRRDG